MKTSTLMPNYPPIYRYGLPGIFLAASLLVGCQPGHEATPGTDTPPSTSPAISLEVIATGSNIAGANGVAIGPDGLLYVASVLGSTITVLDPDSGDVVRTWGLEDGVIGPDDLAFGPDGSWFWTSIMTGEVGGFDADGNKVIAAQLTPGVNPITFSDDGRLFVAQCFFGDDLYEVDPKGINEARLISDQLGPGCGLNGMDWGPDGRLYGPRWFNGEVISFNVDDNTYRLEATGFSTPAAVKFSATGELHVLDTGTGAVIKVDDGKMTEVAMFSPGLDNFVFDSDGRLFVSSFADGFVSRRDNDGTVTELQPGGMSHSGGVTFHQGEIITADLHAIRGYHLDGSESFVQRNVLRVGIMGSALNIASDGDNLLLTSWVDGDVRVWDQTNQRRVWQKAALAGPVAAVRYAGLVVVAEHGTHRVVGFSDSDDSVEIVFAAELPAPTGLFAVGETLYVSDRVLGQILKVAAAGKPLALPEVVVGGLTTPEGFIVRDGNFIVVEADTGAITEIDATGNRRHLGTITPGSQAASPAEPPSQVFNGIAQDNDGNLYVAGETERKLFRIKANQ
ncbi:MAG: hypothetical protein ABGY43_15150 [bacterium]|nr:hypothetical protein [Gammaproteobacteria bacterium]HIL82972.1 hypothetical protein [Pseudomonadales bacterium]